MLHTVLHQVFSDFTAVFYNDVIDVLESDI
jgi:hypothetical protein